MEKKHLTYQRPTLRKSGGVVSSAVCVTGSSATGASSGQQLLPPVISWCQTGTGAAETPTSSGLNEGCVSGNEDSADYYSEILGSSCITGPQFNNALTNACGSGSNAT